MRLSLAYQEAALNRSLVFGDPALAPTRPLLSWRNPGFKSLFDYLLVSSVALSLHCRAQHSPSDDPITSKGLSDHVR